MEDVMASALYASVPTPHDKWAVVLLDHTGRVYRRLPCECETEAEAHRYAKAFLNLYS
jgi:hypothetical protein